MDDIAFVRFTNADVMRHSLVTRIVRAYEAREPEAHGRAKSPARRGGSPKSEPEAE
jgi:phosphate starvation-inducible protein PhoH